ncbi:MAG: ABC transporter permease [Bilifractor sp.]
MMKVKQFTNKNQYTVMLLFMLVVVLIFFSITKGKVLWTGDTWNGIAMQFPEYGIMTLGVMFCFITGNIDMSFVALGNFATIMAVRYMAAQAGEGASDAQIRLAILTGILITLVICLIGGLINGILVTKLGIPPVMATIAMQLVWQGLSTALTQGNTVTGLPTMYTDIGHSKVFGFIPFPLFIFIIAFIICTIILRYTVYGEMIYMIGTNVKAVRYSGINTDRLVIITFMLTALISGVGSLIMVSTMASAKADYGSSYVMRVILILVLAGILPDGGMGKISDLLFATIIIQIIASGVNMFAQLNTYYASLIWGGMLLIVLILSTKLANGIFQVKEPVHAGKKEAEKKA